MLDQISNQIQNQMLAQENKDNLIPQSNYQRIKYNKKSKKKINSIIEFNKHFRLKLLFNSPKFDTEKTYMQKCKTDAIERTLQDQKFLLSNQGVSQFLTEDIHHNNNQQVKKIKKQLTNLNIIKNKMYRNVELSQQQEGRHTDLKVQKHQRVISTDFLPPIKKIQKNSYFQKDQLNQSKNTQKKLEWQNGTITFRPYYHSLNTKKHP